MPSQNGVTEHKVGRATARYVSGLHQGAANGQTQGGRACSGIEHNGFAKNKLSNYHIARIEQVADSTRGTTQSNLSNGGRDRGIGEQWRATRATGVACGIGVGAGIDGNAGGARHHVCGRCESGSAR